MCQEYAIYQFNVWRQKLSNQNNKQAKLTRRIILYFSLKNKNASTIIQNNVFVSFPIKVQKGTTSNPLKAMATGNRLNIKKDEEVELHVFIPKETIEDNKYLDTEHPEVDVIGYHDEVKDENHFGITSPLE